MKDGTICSVSLPILRDRYKLECVNEESMSVFQMVTQNKVVYLSARKEERN